MMATIQAVRCDNKGCPHIQEPADGAAIPESWLSLDVYQEGQGQLEMRVFCSWACVTAWSGGFGTQPKKRVRRTREQIAADALHAQAAQEEPSAV
jgi:hypothetical protein